MCNLVMFIVGSGFVPLLPIYATRLGADESAAGYYLSIGFLALAVSSIFAGWLANRFQRRKIILIAAGVLMIPISWLMGQVSTITALIILTASLWFMVGIAITMVSLLTGLFVDESERGRVFGIIGLAPALAGIIGGLVSGPIVDRWGYTTLFTLGAVVYILMPFCALLLVDKPPLPRPLPSTESNTQRQNFMLGRIFLLLFFASVLAHIANSQIVLGRSLIMDKRGFDATAISSTGAMGGIITLPLPVFIGWLSDRLGRKPLIILCYLASLIGLAVLAFASSLWHFWAAMALQSVIAAGFAVGSALVTDLVPRESLAAPLSLYSASQFIGYVIGFAGAGTVIKLLGMSNSLAVGGVLCLLAIGLLFLVRQPRSLIQLERS